VAQEEKVCRSVFADGRVPSAQNEPNELIFADGPASSCPQQRRDVCDVCDVCDVFAG